jgi:hypothetical protein
MPARKAIGSLGCGDQAADGDIHQHIPGTGTYQVRRRPARPVVKVPDDLGLPEIAAETVKVSIWLRRRNVGSRYA